jgi:predicted transcriptional regulator
MGEMDFALAESDKMSKMSDMASEDRRFQDVTEAELAVLRALWEAGDADHAAGGAPGVTIRSITNELYPGGATSHYATVQKLLERLEEKGFVARDRSESVHRFSATVAKEQLIGRRLRAMADALCDGSLAPLLTTLVPSLSPAEVRELKELVERMDRPPRSKKR